jgi:hypothetical protein
MSLQNPRSSTSGQLLDLVPAQQRHGLVGADPHPPGDQRSDGHDVTDKPGGVGLEAHVAVGDDAEQPVVAVDDGYAGDAVATAQGVRLADRRVRPDGHWLGHHAGLGTLDQVDLLGLLLEGQVAVQDAHAALAGHRDGHPGLGDGVHRAGQQRHLDGDIARDAARGVGLARDDVGLAREQQDVVEGEAQGGELLGDAGRGQLHGAVIVATRGLRLAVPPLVRSHVLAV